MKVKNTSIGSGDYGSGTWTLQDNIMKHDLSVRFFTKQDIKDVLSSPNKVTKLPISYTDQSFQVFVSATRVGHGALSIFGWVFSARQVKKIRNWAFNRILPEVFPQLVTITVTEEDIKQGQKNVVDGKSKATSCAIALAGTRILGHPFSWGFSGGTIRLLGVDYDCVEEDKGKVRHFVNDHDGLRKVEPFQFTIEKA